ncbi:MAG: TerC family protein [Planctomycetota bacterium]|nr:MAG: TerC family protein [Planctomycetota bacterium]RLS93864.1 MAG: TerC family protein [Planctomycetota bacterium]
MDIAALFSAENLLALATLTLLEIVLGVDNVVFIAVLSGRLPEAQQKLARRIGLIAAMVMRILLLLSISWVMGLGDELLAFNSFGHALSFSAKDLILIGGGALLMVKSVREIHHLVAATDEQKAPGKYASFNAVIVQIAIMDIIFSLDSVITAVGMADDISIMVIAVVISVAVMMVAAEPISNFVQRRRSLKMLALSFLILIGTMLVAEGFGQHVSKGYIYFAMAFGVGVEMLNILGDKIRAKLPSMKKS